MHSNYNHLGYAVIQFDELDFLYRANRAGFKWKLVIEFGPDGFAFHYFR